MRNNGGCITFLSQPNRFVFLVGSEIQPSSLESNLQRKTQEDVKTKKKTAFNHVNHLKEHLGILKFQWHFP